MTVSRVETLVLGWISTGNAATVVGAANRSIRQKRNFDIVTKATHRLVARVVEYFPDEVVKAGNTVVPMYIPGRRLTASKPSRTVI